MSHINYSFNQTDDSLPRDKMKLRNIASTRYSGDWPSIPHSHSYAELFYIVDGAGQFQINDKLFPVQAHQLVVVNPNVIHTEVSLESHPLEYIVLGIEGLEFTISDAAEGSFCVYTFDGNNDVLPCMRKILTEMQNRESNFRYFVRLIWILSWYSLCEMPVYPLFQFILGCLLTASVQL